MQLEKVYEPQRFEPHWAQWWIESGIFQVDAKWAQARRASGAHDARSENTGRTFSLVIPPPNVTGSLHIGHMLEHTIMDVAVRWHRMQGEITLWLPGTDHAGIATQMVVERQLASEGLTRKQLGREEFERRVWQWKEEYGGRINHQIRREGASVDWSRERFTMDPGLSRAVRETFVRLWDKGLIYRGEYMVNWCPRCQTAISDVETAHEAIEGYLWHIRYQIRGSGEALIVATTRPETMLGDTALVVHPEDKRYLHLHGTTAILPILGREIPIIADPLADPAFGTGVVKVTPAHDPNDFEVGKRHKLPFVKVIGEDARMTNAAGPYAGLDRFEARKRIVAALEQSGELVKTEPYTVSIAKCDRCKTIIEPLVSTQWFVRIKPLAAKAMEAVRSGKIRFVPDDREIIFFQWMENIRDWCISRQLWWGHRIPAWHCHNCQEITVARETPALCPKCHSTEVEQDSDVLDTWFSSGLWPFSTLGWPDDTEDLRTFYPTSLLITGFDILFFWVSRMIMLGIECTGDVPFREVHLHGLVRDAERQKISKTKGNVVDPLDLIERYGTDACRIALLISAAPGADIALKTDRIESARAFANKLWNASRLLFMNMERSGIDSWDPKESTGSLSTEDVWIEERLNSCAAIVDDALKAHRYHEAAQALWDFVWKEFCDWYLEVKKLQFDSHALSVYERMLRLLHPFMPFVTEELWQRLMSVSPAEHAKSLSLAPYPKPSGSWSENKKVEEFRLIQRIVTNAREIRADRKIDPKLQLESTLHLRDGLLSRSDLTVIESLAKLKITQTAMVESTDVALPFTLTIALDSQSNGASRLRLEKDNARLEKAIVTQSRQLNDHTFVSKAPAHVIESMRAKLAEYQAQLKKNRELLDNFE
ncbi:MAG TPA: valine--tRNA ligase [Bryobacteraceae bacterium]|nr:valine--tRNA ligase [Bryobacteraceae bacterium]